MPRALAGRILLVLATSTYNAYNDWDPIWVK